jgi:hypothetical protein
MRDSLSTASEINRAGVRPNGFGQAGESAGWCLALFALGFQVSGQLPNLASRVFQSIGQRVGLIRTFLGSFRPPRRA